MSLACIDCILAVQSATAVAKNFSLELVDGVLWCTLIDIRTNVETRFKAEEHFVHIFAAAINNFAGEDYACLSNRGNKEYVPVIVTGRYFSFASAIQIFNVRSSYGVHCARLAASLALRRVISCRAICGSTVLSQAVCFLRV